MAKAFDSSQFPDPPKPSFPVEIVPPSHNDIGGMGGFGKFDFRSMFLQFMQEAGEALGRAARDEIEKSRVAVAFGEKPAGEPLTGRGYDWRRLTPGERAARDFLASARLPNFAAGRMFGSVAGIAGLAAGTLIHAPADAASLAESQRRFANVSPEMASVFIQSDQRRMFRDMTSGANLAPSNRALLRELDKFRDSAAQVTDKVTEIKNVLYENILGVINEIAGPAIEYFLGARKQVETQPWVQKLQDLADLDKADRAAAAQKAKGGVQPIGPIPKGMNIGWMNGNMVWMPKDPNFIGPPALVGGP